MTRAEYSLMKDSALDRDSFDGWTYFVGVRLYL